MRVWRWIYVGALALCLVVGLGVWNPLSQLNAKNSLVPRYVVDPFWPKPLPIDPTTGKPWVTGEVGGTCVDSRDHVFTVNRAFQNGLVAPETVIAVPSPPVIEYDRRGNVVNAWGDPARLPNSIHGCFVDYQDNVWIAGNGDGIVQKYTHDGNFLLQIGEKGVCDGPNGTSTSQMATATTALQFLMPPGSFSASGEVQALARVSSRSATAAIRIVSLLVMTGSCTPATVARIESRSSTRRASSRRSSPLSLEPAPQVSEQLDRRGTSTFHLTGGRS
jgi:hypothetical protein